MDCYKQNSVKQSLKLLILLFACLQMNCLGSPATSSVIEDSVSVDEETDTTIDATDGDASPLSSTQLPSSTDDDTTITSYLTADNILISNGDANDDVVVQGSVADYDSSYGVAVVNTTQYAIYQKEQNTFLAKLSNIASEAIDHFFSLSLRGPKGRGNPVMPVAWADTSGCFTDNSYITEITVTSEGTIDPQAIANYNSGDELKIFYFDTTTCDTGTETAVDVIENLLYVAQASAGRSSIATDSAGNINQTDASGNVINITASEETGFVVQSSFDVNYTMASLGSSVTALAYNTSASDFVFQSSELVSAYDYADGGFTLLGDSSTICVTANGCSPVAVKNKNDKAYFITEYDDSVSAVNYGYIKELYDNTSEEIQFLDPTILDSHSRPIRFRSAKAFDVVVDGASYNEVLVIFEDGRGNTRLFGLFGDYRIDLYPIVTERLSGISDIQDLIIYSAQPSNDAANGSAFLTTADAIYFIDYDFIETACEEDEEGCTDDSTALSVDTSNPISISNLTSVVVNDAGTYAYALADDTIHVINLSSHTTESTVALTDVIGHNISFGASAILYTSIGETNYLVVSSDSLKAAIVVDLSQSYE